MTTKLVTESPNWHTWHVVGGKKCEHCHTYVAVEWVSDEGHRVRFKQSGGYSGYDPQGLCVMKDIRHSNHEDAFAECVAASKRSALGKDVAT